MAQIPSGADDTSQMTEVTSDVTNGVAEVESSSTEEKRAEAVDMSDGLTAIPAGEVLRRLTFLLTIS
jgi:hypothetical protein